MNDEKKSVNNQQKLKPVYIAKPTHEALQRACIEGDMVMGRVVNRLIVDYLGTMGKGMVDPEKPAIDADYEDLNNSVGGKRV